MQKRGIFDSWSVFRINRNRAFELSNGRQRTLVIKSLAIQHKLLAKRRACSSVGKFAPEPGIISLREEIADCRLEAVKEISVEGHRKMFRLRYPTASFKPMGKCHQIRTLSFWICFVGMLANVFCEQEVPNRSALRLAVRRLRIPIDIRSPEVHVTLINCL